jgi:hypothetical protein
MRAIAAGNHIRAELARNEFGVWQRSLSLAHAMFRVFCRSF